MARRRARGARGARARGDEDDTAAETGAGCGNLLARIPGPPGARTVMLCAHLDTVPLADRVEVELVDGVYRNRREAILGADNKAGVAVLLEAARRWAARARRCGCELLFTTSEEIGLRGAQRLRHGPRSRPSSATSSTTRRRSAAWWWRRRPTTGSMPSSWAAPRTPGIRPEDGRSAIGAAAKAIEAMRLGRIDEETTANVGRDRGRDGGERRAGALQGRGRGAQPRRRQGARGVREMVDAITWAASATETDVDTTVEEQFRAYRIPESDPAVVVAAAALRDCGVEPVPTSTGGGSDANAFEAKGLRCLNIANGTEPNHTPDERVSVAALETMLDVTLRLRRARGRTVRA